MALVRLPEGQQRSGSIGATVWSHNRFGPYVRARSIPVNPNTDRQAAVRNAVRALAIAWQNELTQAQRDAWKVYADNVSWLNRLGEVVTLTALNHYIRSNTPLVQSAIARVDDAPVIFNLGDAEAALGGSASEATQLASVTWDDTAAWASEDGAYQFVSCGLPQNGNIGFFGGPWRLLSVISGNSGVPPTSPTSATWQFPFGEGQRLWLRSRIARADGRLSEFARFNFLAGA